MKILKSLRFLPVIILAIVIALNISCGGGGNDDGGGGGGEKQAEEFVQDLVTLETALSTEALSADEFLEQFYDILSQIDGSAESLDYFKAYVETNVSGYPVESTSVMFASKAIKSTDVGTLINQIKQSSAYQFLENFFTSVIFSAVPEPASQMIQAASPETFVSLSTTVVAIHLKDALVSNKISIDVYQQLYEINQTNPYEAERQLLAAQGLPIPSWLEPSPSGCMHNCGYTSGIYSGTFTGSGSFSRVFPETTCTWSITFSGGATLTMLADTDGSITGSRVRVAGTTTWNATSGSVPARTCESSSGSFDDTADATGYITNMTWATDLLGGSNVFVGTYVGAQSGSAISGNITVSYSYGSGSATLPLTMTK